MKIFKERFAIGNNYVSVYKSAKILCARMQDGKPTFWYVFSGDIKEDYKTIIVSAIPTGQKFSLGDNYITTLEQYDLIWHVFTDCEIYRDVDYD